MANSCSITLKVDKLPKVINKVEYFLFRAMEQNNVNFFQIAENPGYHLAGLMSTARTLIDNQVMEYIKKSSAAAKKGDAEASEDYAAFAANLQNITANWNQVVASTMVYSTVFKTKNKFKLDDDGLVDLSELADDEDAIYKKFIVDQAANEIDPFDSIDKAVEIFIRSIPREGYVNDEYGFNVSVDYASFVRNLMADLEGSITIDEIVDRLQANLEKTPEYQHIIDMLEFRPSDNSVDIQLKINFRNSFAKAQIPIYNTSIEGGTVKVFEATVARRSKYEQTVKSNFVLRGMPVEVNGKQINLAHEEDGTWTLDQSDVEKILDYLNATYTDGKIKYGDKLTPEEKVNRRVAFLKGLGFDFSPKAEETIKKTIGSKKYFDYIFTHLITRLSVPNTKGKTDITTDPLSSIKTDWYTKGKKSAGQNNVINDIIEVEIKYNPAYNIERSVINPEGNRQHSTQLHNNFTILNKYFSDIDAYPTLQSIIESEPSMAWLSPETNPGIRSSMYLNSLFFLDPASPEYGMRKRVYSDKNGKYKFSSTQGVYVTLNVINTGGVQLKDDGNFKVDGSSTTGLNEADKLIQDLNTFLKIGFSSMTRLSDKSTDLAIFSNFYSDPLTGDPYKRPLGALEREQYRNVFTSEPFMMGIVNALKDLAGMKYLGYRGFYNNLDFASKNILDTWGELDKVLSKETKEVLDDLLKSKAITSVEQAEELIADEDVLNLVHDDVQEYFKTYSEEYLKKLEPVKNLVESKYLIGAGSLVDSVNFYLANTFLMDLENMKLFFGGSIHFKDFHKRASKDSATGIFTFVEPKLLDVLNDRENAQGYGVNTNLSARMLAERLFMQGKITQEERDRILSNQTVTKEIKSALLEDVKFDSKQPAKIAANIERLYQEGHISEENYQLYKDSIKQVIEDNYNGDEADGQGKVTFDFYRVMSILTNNWGQEQERVYKKIVEYSHWDELAEGETDETKRAEYLQKRDAVGYNPAEQVYFPPKKFQYSGPMKHEKFIDGQLYNALVPMFDKFSLHPLIPTIIKGTEDEDLAKRMELEGVSYVKFKSASKAETPKTQDKLYEGYDRTNPEMRAIQTFEQRLKDGNLGFKSEHTIFMNHLKEQVRIDAEVHDNVIFGSQARKLILMNLLSLTTTHNKAEFTRLYNQYKGLIDDLVQIEKTLIYDKLGIKSENGTLQLANMEKLVKYFRDEISKKNQDSNVRKALELDEKTGKFKIPLDAAVQAQIIEGILISSINNNIVRYKASGSMLTQVAITGSAAKKFSKEASEKALETYGNTELKYYDLETIDGKTVVSAMQVKVGLTEQWLPLLQLAHSDGNKIGSIERLNESLKDKAWVDKNRNSIRMISYRIPTQGRNFLDVMEVAEFLPAQFGDAIIMPTEAIIKSGSDFDIDKMFVFYPNMRSDGTYDTAEYNKQDLKRLDAGMFKSSIQNKLYQTMAEIILHPNNYMELVTPSTNYHIMPIVNDIYEKLGLKQKDKDRPKTDYKNTDILNRNRNIEKFLSLLNGKSDLGIAALANTFNVLFQLAEAKGNPDFFSKNNIKSFFSSKFMSKDKNNTITGLYYGDIYDEDGMLKSEFFSEFINAFVDVAKDDYVFGINVVTEFSPMIFYMKFTGLGSEKILNFINQPILRTYIKNLSKYENMFVKNYLDTQATDVERQLLQYTDEELFDAENEEAQKLQEKLSKLKSSARTKALSETLKQFGFAETLADKDGIKTTLGDKNYSGEFTAKNLYNNIQNIETFDPKKLTQGERNFQLAVLYEMLNQKEQSDSMTIAQRFLNFDTKPYVSAFDVYSRNVSYAEAVTAKKDSNKNNVLSHETLRRIKKESVISPLDVSTEIVTLLETLLPVRNNRTFNKIILQKAIGMKTGANKNIRSDDDMMRYARTVKNDFMNYVIQNFFADSTTGTEFFKETFGTDKSLNEYLKELIETNKLRKQLTDIRALDYYQDLLEIFPILGSIVVQPGDNNKNIITYRFIENSSNPVEKQSMISQFEDMATREEADFKLVRDFARNLALYSVFQSGYNTSDLSYTGITPVALINTLYASAVAEFEKLTPQAKIDQYENFFKLFSKNNPGFYSTRKTTETITGETAKKGKWYTNSVSLEVKRKESKKPKAEKKMVDNSKELTMQSYNVDSIKMGAKTLTSRNNKIRDGVYKLVNKEGNTAFVELKLYKQISVLDLNTQEKKEAYAKKEGFKNWLDLEYKVEMGYTKTLTKEFLEGNQKVFVYTIKYLPEKGKAVDPLKGVEEKTGPGPVAVKIFKFNRQSPEIGTDADQAMRKIATSSIVEFKSDKVKSSSLTTLETVGEDNSYSYEKDRYVGVSNTGGLKDGRVNFGSIVMLARNGKLTGTKLSPETIAEINEAHKQGARFIVGDMPGVDTPFIEHLNSIGAVYAIYGHGRLAGVSDVEKTVPKKVTPESLTQTPVDNNSKIDAFRETLVWNLDMTNGELEEMYNKEKLSGELIEEFLKRMSCLGKLK